MNLKKLLIIGHVWPEPTSSAAGWRMLQLATLFIQCGYEVHFASAAIKNEHSYPLAKEGVQEHEIQLNNRSFDKFVQRLCPDVVLFDRFMVEEQYSWRIAENAPNAVRVLDTEDLHFLRAARQNAFQKGETWHENLLYSDVTKRELAAILRSDLSIIISTQECRILEEKFGISDRLIHFLPFLLPEEDFLWKAFDERKDMVFIGNFLHEPNWQTVRLLKTVYWPMIRKRLPKVELHIYGAYPSQKVLQLHQPKEGFHIKGRAEHAVRALSEYRVLLAPIPFGAGLKGKFVDAWQAGTPSVTTSVGAEGFETQEWSGFMTDNQQELVEKCVQLYQNASIWLDAQQKAKELLVRNTATKEIAGRLITRIDDMANRLTQHRQQNFLGQILQTQQLNATKYMSLWIEEKNKGSRLGTDKGTLLLTTDY